MDIIFGVDFTSRIDQIGAIVELCKVAASRYKRLHKVVIAHSISVAPVSMARCWCLILRLVCFTC